MMLSSLSIQHKMVWLLHCMNNSLDLYSFMLEKHSFHTPELPLVVESVTAGLLTFERYLNLLSNASRRFGPRFSKRTVGLQ